MSTYYYLVCDSHRSYCDAISRVANGNAVWLCDAEEKLPNFLLEHQSCPLRLISEHEDDLIKYPNEGEPYTEHRIIDQPTSAPS